MSASDIIMGVLSSHLFANLSVSDFILAGEAFGHEETTIRSALTRLTKSGTLHRKGRGIYGIGEQGEALFRQIVRWRERAERKISWDGRWLMVSTGPEDRKNRTIWRRTERALYLLGFVEGRGNMWVRPDNLYGGVASLRKQMAMFRASRSVFCAVLDELGEKADKEFCGLWDIRSLAEKCENLTKVI